MAAQNAAPALSAPASAERTRRGPPLLSGPVGPADEAVDAPSWAALGAKFGREAPRALPAPADLPAPLGSTEMIVDAEQVAEAGGSEFESPNQPVAEAIWRMSEMSEIELAEGHTATAPREHTDDAWRSTAVETNTVGADLLDEPAPSAEPIVAEEQHQQQADAAADIFTAQSHASPLDDSRHACWIALLQADNPARFKLWSMELIAQPSALPTILSALTNNPTTIDASDDPRYQRALADALAASIQSPTQVAEALAPESAPDDEPPDWLSLRMKGQAEV
jgi:hypothetical protein